MDAFNGNLRVFGGDVAVAEIPEAFNSQFHQLIDGGGSSLAGDAQHRHGGAVFPAKIVQNLGVANGDASYHIARHGLVFIEYSDKVEASRLKGHVGGNGAAKIAGADKDGLESVAQAQYFSYFVMKLLNVVAVSLLSESAEAVEVLADLRSGKPHFI